MEIARFSSIVCRSVASRSILNPASLNRWRASERRRPSTAGTGRMPGPSETVISTWSRSRRSWPARGRWETTRSRGWRRRSAADGADLEARLAQPLRRGGHLAPDDVGHRALLPAAEQLVAAMAAAATSDEREQRHEGPPPARASAAPRRGGAADAAGPVREAGASPVTMARTSSSAAMNASASAKRRSGSFSSAAARRRRARAGRRR